MENCTNDFCRAYPHLFVEESLKISKEIDVHEWFMMGPYTTILLTLAYLIFVLKVGPRLMDKKKGYELKALIRVYNVVQVFYNTNTFLQVFAQEGGVYYLINYSCKPITLSTNPLAYKFTSTAWLYMINKAMDLLDTVFFVVTKKQDHVTFLHVYHHSVMMVSTWYFLKYVQAQHMAFCGLINSFVHIFMYFYYFVSSFGPKMKPYLWWKHWVTVIQLLQFVICSIYMMNLLINDCNIPFLFTVYAELNAFFFLYLFAKFYYDSYIKKKKN